MRRNGAESPSADNADKDKIIVAAITKFRLSSSMDEIDAVCLWAVHQRIRRRRQKEERKYWVHPILKTRLSSSQYITLYPKLRDHDEKFFNYFRMSIESFDDLLDLIKNELEANEQAVRYCISPQEKLIVTLR
ncbi:hypothetical protein QTP88_016366 [Uroleucon formosanum]